MNPPATIKILHLDFELRFADETFFDAANAFGYCDKKRLIIMVCEKLRPALKADTTLHEIFHGIHFAVGCEETMTEEQIALQFAGPLCMVLRDNPKLFMWLRELLNPNLASDMGMLQDDVDDGAYQ